ncbi:hypothetical protein [Owenweeksia hongkongensis]|nr:hypothetical protein [Owenweeksia hongkongensis]
MNFQEKISDFVLGNRTISQTPDIALTALNEGIESKSIIILAGMSDRDSPFELQQYFDHALRETKITLPTKLDAARKLVKYYLKQLISAPQETYSILIKLDNKVYKTTQWNITNPELPSTCIGEELGLHHLYTWYRELSDFNDGSRLLYYNDLPRDKQKEQFETRAMEEAHKWLKLNRN